MLPFATVTVLVAPDKPVPVHPLNEYPFLDGVTKLKLADSILYEVLWPEIEPPFAL